MPEDGVILPKTEYVLRDSDTVTDVLHRAVRYNKIQFEYKVQRTMRLVLPMSKVLIISMSFLVVKHLGGVFAVNGEFPNYGSSNYVLEDGDRSSGFIHVNWVKMWDCL